MFIKLKDNKIIFGFSKTKQYIILFFLNDDMFQPLNHHQTIFTKLGIKCMAVQTTLS